MNRKFRIGIFVFLIILQIVVYRYENILKINMDFLYLILVYISVKSGFYKTILSATVIGLVTDYFCMTVMGVFGFSRTITAYLLNEISRHIDLKNSVLVFFLIAISLFISNLVANMFFFIILGVKFSSKLILFQPICTGLVGAFILIPSKIKKYLDVY